MGCSKMMSVRSSLTVETSPIRTSSPSTQNLCQFPGIRVTLSPGSRRNTAPGANSRRITAFLSLTEQFAMLDQEIMWAVFPSTKFAQWLQWAKPYLQRRFSLLQARHGQKRQLGLTAAVDLITTRLFSTSASTIYVRVC